MAAGTCRKQPPAGSRQERTPATRVSVLTARQAPSWLVKTPGNVVYRLLRLRVAVLKGGLLNARPVSQLQVQVPSNYLC
jgi:hypothetical protein